MKKQLIFLTLSLILFSSNKIIAQENSEKESEAKELVVTGSPIITVFADYHAGIGAQNNISGFGLSRALLGYQFKLSPTLTGRAVIDAAVSPAEEYLSSQKREVYLRNAMLTWKDKGFTINGGLTGLYQFNLQERFWGYRYVAPSFQDQYKMGQSVDMGVTVEYQFMPWLSSDFSITNGEGFRNLNMDNKYRYALGLTLQPIENLTFRVYGDVFQQSEQNETQRTLALFAGYKTKYFSLGTEYNYQENSRWIAENNFSGYSVYTTIPINKKWNLYGRYDNIDSKDKDQKSWSNFTGEAVIAGVEYHPIKQLKIAPNYKYTKNFDAQQEKSDFFHVVYLNILFNW